jgi:small subunit ribosomal protein S7
MPRKKRVIHKEVLPDPKYHDTLVTLFINNLMKRGKKSTAETIFYDAVTIVEQKTKQPGIDGFKQALNNIKPVLEVRPLRVGGATYQVPMEVRFERQTSLAIRWLVEYARARAGKGIVDQLAGEILDAASEKGSAFKKREDVHKMAESNRAFAHYRW